ncbi:hypothetical protein [Haloprofundus halophilus]|uniref:hypothetical protein n=1 Tax=Haloprofundus halophilus TaxID=2283527 RepID=UPI001300305B|nr:hypothetical protein [Haloprofundus halophilus]
MTSVLGRGRQLRRAVLLLGCGVTLAAATLLAAVAALYVVQTTPRGVLSWYGLAFGAGLIGAAPVVANELLGRVVEARRTATARRRKSPVPPVSSVPPVSPVPPSTETP